MKKILLLAALAILIGRTEAHNDAKPQIPSKTEISKDGAQAEVPSVKLKDIDGKDVDIKTLANQGKITVISFWATWCSPCKKELDNINDVIDDWQKKYDLQLVAVSIDDSRNSLKVKPYVQGKKWDFTVLLDVNNDTQRSFNIPNVPYTVLVDKTGHIVYTHQGYVEGDEQILESKIKALK
jgi:peroxiredoxin